MKILIDADACPRAVLQLCCKWGKHKGIPVWTVASFNHNIDSDHHVVVGNASQEADIKLMNLSEAGDIVVTQDWGLAAMLLGRGARCISPNGREYDNQTMDFLLEEREVKARVRRSGGHTKGPRKRSPGDDQHFERTLLRMLEINK